MFSPSSSGGSGSSVFSAYVNGRVPYEVYWESSPNPGFALYAGVSRFHRPFLIGAAHLVTCWKGSRRAYSECGETGNLDAAPALAGIWAEVAVFTGNSTVGFPAPNPIARGIPRGISGGRIPREAPWWISREIPAAPGYALPRNPTGISRMRIRFPRKSGID